MAFSIPAKLKTIQGWFKMWREFHHNEKISLCESAELMNAEMGDARSGLPTLLTRSLL